MWMFSFTGWWSKPRMQQNFWLSFFFPPFLAMKYLLPCFPLGPDGKSILSASLIKGQHQSYIWGTQEGGIALAIG